MITFKTAPDYETKNSYSLTVRAMDSSNNISTKDVTIDIADMVEDAPLTTFQSGDTWKGFTYNIITSPITGRQWLDRNLGASRVCTSSTDTSCYGDYYQWGRLADGHEKADSILSQTDAQASDISNVGNEFIQGLSLDWTRIDIDSNGTKRSAQWSKTDGTGVCPIGFRVPTIIELENETLIYAGTDNISTGAVKVTNSSTAFQNFLKFPVSGYRSYSNGSVYDIGLWGYVWSTSAMGGISSLLIGFDSSNGGWDYGFRGNALSIRCVKGN